MANAFLKTRDGYVRKDHIVLVEPFGTKNNPNVSRVRLTNESTWIVVDMQEARVVQSINSYIALAK